MANCTAVNRTLVSAERKATKAAPASPAERLSALMTRYSSGRWLPAADNARKSRLVAADNSAPANSIFSTP